MKRIEMVEEVMIARKREMSPDDIYNALLYALAKPLDYITKVYDLFLLDKEHVEFYYALLVR